MVSFRTSVPSSNISPNSNHLGEIYGQVDRSFGMFVERNWGLLKSWDNNFSTLEQNNDYTVLDFVLDESEYWDFSEFYFLMEKSYMIKVFNLYEEATGNKLDLITFDDVSFEAEAAKRFAEGKVPDIFMPFHNSDLNRFNVGESFYYMNSEDWITDLTDSLLTYCQDSDGNILGLSFWESSVSGCYYNKTLLDSIGLKPAATQAEFDVLCQVLLETGYTPICWPSDGCTWMFQFGLDPIFADDHLCLSNINKNEIFYSEIPDVKSMVNWISDAAQKGWFGHKSSKPVGRTSVRVCAPATQL